METARVSTSERAKEHKQQNQQPDPFFEQVKIRTVLQCTVHTDIRDSVDVWKLFVVFITLYALCWGLFELSSANNAIEETTKKKHIYI